MLSSLDSSFKWTGFDDFGISIVVGRIRGAIA